MMSASCFSLERNMKQHQIQSTDLRVLSFADYGNPGDIAVLCCHGGPGSRMEPKSNAEAVRAAALHSRIYTPEAALEAGFLDQLVPAGQGVEAAFSVAEERSRLAGKAYAVTKQRMRKTSLELMAAELHAEADKDGEILSAYRFHPFDTPADSGKLRAQ